MRYLLENSEYRSPVGLALTLCCASCLPIGNEEMQFQVQWERTNAWRSSFAEAEGQAGETSLESIETAEQRRASGAEDVMRILAIRNV